MHVRGMTIATLFAVLLALAACEDAPSTSTYLTEEIPPCTPVEGSSVDPYLRSESAARTPLPENQRPAVVAQIADLTTKAGGGNVTIELSNKFSGPDSDTLRYTAISSSPTIAGVSLSDSRMTVMPVARGSTTVTVTACDRRTGRLSVSQSLTVIVLAELTGLRANGRITPVGNVTLRWDPVFGADGYEVLYAEVRCEIVCYAEDWINGGDVWTDYGSSPDFTTTKPTINGVQTIETTLTLKTTSSQSSYGSTDPLYFVGVRGVNASGGVSSWSFVWVYPASPDPTPTVPVATPTVKNG